MKAACFHELGRSDEGPWPLNVISIVEMRRTWGGGR